MTPFDSHEVVLFFFIKPSKIQNDSTSLAKNNGVYVGESLLNLFCIFVSMVFTKGTVLHWHSTLANVTQTLSTRHVHVACEHTKPTRVEDLNQYIVAQRNL